MIAHRTKAHHVINTIFSGNLLASQQSKWFHRFAVTAERGLIIRSVIRLTLPHSALDLRRGAVPRIARCQSAGCLCVVLPADSKVGSNHGLCTARWEDSAVHWHLTVCSSEQWEAAQPPVIVARSAISLSWQCRTLNTAADTRLPVGRRAWD